MTGDHGSEAGPYAVSLLAGAVGWFVLQAATGREAWDNGAYFAVFYPALVVLAGIVGFLSPRRPWRWGLSQFGAQAAVLFLFNPTGGMMPLGLIAFAVLSIPSIVGAYAGAFLGSRLAGR